MSTTEGMNLGVGVPTEQDGPRTISVKRGYRHSNPNLEDIMVFIDALPLPPGDKESLVKAARRVPHGALSNFRANYMNYIKREGRS